MKNGSLLLVVSLLAVANLVFFVLPSKSNRVSFDPDMFKVLDTAALNAISFKTETTDFLIANGPGGWQIEGRHSVDKGLRVLLTNILNRVEVRRPVNDEVGVGNEGVRIELKSDSDIRAFTVSGNPTKTKTYFTDESGSYEVEIPGYRDYLGSIFELKANQWRDRTILNGNWRTIQSLRVDHPAQTPLQMKFEGAFFSVGGVQSLDSNRVVQYLDGFQNFEANEIIDINNFPELQELSEGDPIGSIFMSTINNPSGDRLEFFEQQSGQSFRLVRFGNGELAVIEEKRLKALLRTPEFFRFRPD